MKPCNRTRLQSTEEHDNDEPDEYDHNATKQKNMTTMQQNMKQCNNNATE